MAEGLGVAVGEERGELGPFLAPDSCCVLPIPGRAPPFSLHDSCQPGLSLPSSPSGPGWQVENVWLIYTLQAPDVTVLTSPRSTLPLTQNLRENHARGTGTVGGACGWL